MSRAALLALAALAAGGCALIPREAREVPAFEVEPAPFELAIAAEGVLEPADATPIEAPQIRIQQFIAWLAPDGEPVHEGDLLVRIDDTDLRHSLRQARAKVERIRRQLAAKRRALEKERQAIGGEMTLVDRELEYARNSAPSDPRLFSRMEIIDAEVNRKLLEAKKSHLEAKLERYRHRAEAEIQILESQRKTAEVRLAQIEADLGRLEIRAPHDGVFLHRTFWTGEKIRVGSRVWSGTEIGDLSSVERVRAKVWVLESEAAGLAQDLPAEIVPAAHPERRFPARVEQVQTIANPIEEESPVKYFEVRLAVDAVDAEALRPGGRVQARIRVAREEAALAVPNQAIFRRDDRTIVYVDRGGRFEPRPVELGPRSVSRSVVTAGLEPGERIALVEPESAGEG